MSAPYGTMISVYPRLNPIWDGVRDDALTALETAIAAGSYADSERLTRILAEVTLRAGQD